MQRQHRVHKFILLCIICITVVSLLLSGCGSGRVEKETVKTEEEEKALAPPAASEKIPSEAIVSKNYNYETPIIEGTVTFKAGEPAYKIGLVIRHLSPNASQTQGVIDSTYTDRQGKYRFYDNGYYADDKAKYYIYRIFKGQDGTDIQRLK